MPIYEQSFRHYDGPRRTRGLWWPVAVQTMRPMLRSRMVWFYGGFHLVYLVVVGVSFFLSRKLAEMAPQHLEAATQVASAAEVPVFGQTLTLNTVLFMYLDVGLAAMLILVLATAGGCVSADRQNMALPLYFSRPLGLRDYLVGKILGITMLPFLFGTAGLLAIFGQAAAFFFTPARALAESPLMLAGVASLFLSCLLAAVTMVAFSSMSKVSRTASSLFIGFWVLAGAVAGALWRSTREVTWAAVSPRMAWQNVAQALMQPDVSRSVRDRSFADFATLPAVLALAAYVVLFVLIMRRNVKVVEVVR